MLRAFFVFTVYVLDLSKHAALLEFFSRKDTTSIIGNAINAANGRERLIVGRTNFQRTVAVSPAQGSEDICVSEESIGVNSNGLLPGHMSADVPGDNINGSRGRPLIENDQGGFKAAKIGHCGNGQVAASWSQWNNGWKIVGIFDHGDKCLDVLIRIQLHSAFCLLIPDRRIDFINLRKASGWHINRLFVSVSILPNDAQQHPPGNVGKVLNSQV